MKNFSELALSEPILRAITELGYETPSPIQAEALPLLLGNDTDFLGLAATGTGKTAAFGIPLLERIDQKTRGVQALILCPTRELAIQVAGQIDLLGKYIGIKSLPIYGGTGYSEQIYGLKSGATIVVGTPGRVVDHMNKGTLNLSGLKTLILDEADEMISMGFKEDLEYVLSAAPKDQANIWLFSATMGGEVRHVADAYLKNPQKVQVNRTEMLPDTVEQIYYMTHEYDKPDLLTKVMDTAQDFYGIIFCQTKSLVIDVTQFLKSRGYRADCLHGDMDQTGRDRAMKAFRDKNVTVLVATDVACRGLDVKDITHVINYSIPRELDNYVHRIGRTGRSGKSGIAISFVTNSHRMLIGRIENMTKSRMTEGRPPSLKDIALKKVAKTEKTFTENGPQGRMTELLGEEWTTAVADLTKEEIVGRFITLLHPELSGSAKAAKQISDSRDAAMPPREKKEYRDGGRAPRAKFDGGRAAPRSSGPESSSRPTPRAEGSAPYERPERVERSERSFDGPKPAFREGRPSRPAPRFDERPVPRGATGPSSGPSAYARPERRYEGRPAPFKKEFKTDEKRTPPWERKSAPAAFGGGARPEKPFVKRSTPWGGKDAAAVRPKSSFEGKREFSARDASEGKGKPFKKWDSRPTKPRA